MMEDECIFGGYYLINIYNAVGREHGIGKFVSSNYCIVPSSAVNLTSDEPDYFEFLCGGSRLMPAKMGSLLIFVCGCLCASSLVALSRVVSLPRFPPNRYQSATAVGNVADQALEIERAAGAVGFVRRAPRGQKRCTASTCTLFLAHRPTVTSRTNTEQQTKDFCPMIES